MIYALESSFEKQVELLAFFAKSENLEFIVWLYPEAVKINEFISIGVVLDEDIEGDPVTTYDDNCLPQRTKRTHFNHQSIEKITKYKEEIVSNVDSIVLYEKDMMAPLVSTIGHEGMSLVSNDDLYESLAANGFNVSFEPPEWW